MSMVENFVQQLTSANGANVIGGAQKFDLQDDTFAKLLEKQMQTGIDDTDSINQLGQIGIPSGFNIEPFDVQNDTQKINTENKIDISNFKMKDIDMSDYFTNFLSNPNNNKTSIMELAKRQATNAYGTFGREMVEDMSDFIQDIAKMI